MTMTDTKLDLSSLTEDGDTLELPDGRVLRLKIEVDADTTVNDFDCYGKVEWTRRNSFGSVRPAGFSGRARIIDTNWPDNLWWEPYEELTEAQTREETQSIIDLCRDGFRGVILELVSSCDHCHRSGVVESTSLWGIDSLDNGYIHEVVRELADEMGVA